MYTSSCGADELGAVLGEEAGRDGTTVPRAESP